jgi:2-C-methyl-D-erythritol 4-phosphate cytidylyltransferase
MKQFVSAILLAGGVGSRFGSHIPKQFHPLGKKLVAHYSLELLLASPFIQEVVIVCHEMHREHFSCYTSEKIRFAPSGKTRQLSVQEGCKRISPDASFVCIHDSARPLLRTLELHQVIEEGLQHEAATLAVPAKNTIKVVNAKGFVERTLDRSQLWEMQTPQVLSLSLLWDGMKQSEKEQLEATDDVFLAEICHHPVKIVPSQYRNLKITTQEDLVIAEALLKEMYAEV